MNRPVSHENCDHASSKAGRAACRRKRTKFADAFSEIMTETTPVIVEPAPVFEPVRVTQETWRDFKETPVRVATQLDDETQSVHAEGVYITGWGGQWVNYASPIGKVKRASVSCIRVTTMPAE